MNGRIVFLGLLLICVAADARRTEVPRRPECRGEGTMCAMVYEPVCGDNGQTYSNECVMCVALQNTNLDVWIVKNSRC